MLHFWHTGFEPLVFFYKKLSVAEQKYCTYDRQLLSAYQVVKPSRHMLESRAYTLFTDQKHHKLLAIAYLQRVKSVIETTQTSLLYQAVHNNVAACQWCRKIRCWRFVKNFSVPLATFIIRFYEQIKGIVSTKFINQNLLLRLNAKSKIYLNHMVSLFSTTRKMMLQWFVWIRRTTAYLHRSLHSLARSVSDSF